MGGRGSSGLRNNKTLNGISITKDNALPDRSPFTSYYEGNEWIAKTLGVSLKEANDIHNALIDWSNYGSSKIHNERDAEDYAEKVLGMATGKQMAQAIDQYLNSPNVPKYSGDLYRGINSKSMNREQLDAMLKSGIWKEPGITAFSYSKEQANLYTQGSTGSDKVVIVLKNNQHASTIGHLSVGGGEKEALYPSSIKNGIKIVSYTKTPVYYEKFDRNHFRATGEKRYRKEVLNYEYTIVLDDKRRKG